MDKEKGSVEGLKDKLYSRANKGQMQDVRAPLSQEEIEVPKAWSDSSRGLPPREPRRVVSTPESRLSFATKFFIVAVGFFFVAVAVAGVAFFWGPNTISPNNIDLQIVAPSLVDGGKEAQFQIIIDNKNPASLETADLIIDYPSGTRDPKDPTKSLLHERQSLGTVGAASTVKRTSSALLYGAEGTQETIRATIEYSVSGSNAVFTHEGEVTVTIGSAPISLSINAPQEAIAGQAFDMDVEVRSNASDPVDNVVVQGQMPFGYTLQSSTPKADTGTLWHLGTLQPGQSQTIHLTGSIDGQDGDQRVFKFLVGQDADPTDTAISVPYLTMPATVTVTKPFIAGAITVNGQTSSKVSASAGGLVSGTVNWQNNLSTPVSNIVVTLKLDGPMIDKNSVHAGTGFYQSSNNSIVWTSEQDPTLAQAAPGAGGQLAFSFSTLAPGQGGVVYTNPVATLGLSIAGQRPGTDSSSAPQSVNAAASTQITFASQLALTTTAQFISGPRPPVANATSAYSLTWSIKNSSNTIGNSYVSTVLPPYATFISGGDGVTYDQASRTVTWSIGDLKPGVGYSTPALTNSFQITITPSTSQVGSAPDLTGASVFNGTDRFTTTQVQASASALTTVDNVAAGQ